MLTCDFEVELVWKYLEIWSELYIQPFIRTKSGALTRMIPGKIYCHNLLRLIWFFRSSAYIAPNEGGYYFAGGLFGGKAAMFWPLVEKMTKLIDMDLQRNYIAIWHDESYLNRCFMDTPPEIILSPAYCSPEHWPLPYEKKIVAISKRHSVARN